MLVEIPGKVPEGSNADTLLGSGGFRCRYLLRFWKLPVQIPGQLLEGSCADACWGSWPWFLYHCVAPLHACMCMIVYTAEVFKLLGIAPEFILDALTFGFTILITVYTWKAVFVREAYPIVFWIISLWNGWFIADYIQGLALMSLFGDDIQNIHITWKAVSVGDEISSLFSCVMFN